MTKLRSALICVSMLMVSCLKPKVTSETKGFLGVNEADCDVWDGRENIGHCRKLLQNKDLVNYWDSVLGMTKFHTLNWWVFNAHDAVVDKAGVKLEELHLDPGNLARLVLDSDNLVKEFEEIAKSDEACNTKMDQIMRFSNHLHGNRRSAENFVSALLNDSAGSMMATMARPFTNNLFGSEDYESFDRQLTALVSLAKSFGYSSQACEQMTTFVESDSFETAAETINIVDGIIRKFDLGKIIEKIAENQPPVDCRFSFNESNDKADVAYCEIQRGSKYALVFKLQRTSGGLRSKTDTVFQVYRGQPVSTEINGRDVQVCGFEWKVDKFAHLKLGQGKRSCTNTEISAEAIIDVMENEPGVCFYEKKDLNGFKFCSETSVKWVGKDLNDKFSSVEIPNGKCVKVYDETDWNPEGGESSLEKVFYTSQNNLYAHSLGQRVSSFRVGDAVVDASGNRRCNLQ